MERKLREEIVAEVQKAMTVALISLQEQWLTADELCKQFQMFTRDWLEKYGDILPRKRVKVTALIPVISASWLNLVMPSVAAMSFNISRNFSRVSTIN